MVKFFCMPCFSCSSAASLDVEDEKIVQNKSASIASNHSLEKSPSSFKTNRDNGARRAFFKCWSTNGAIKADKQLKEKSKEEQVVVEGQETSLFFSTPASSSDGVVLNDKNTKTKTLLDGEYSLEDYENFIEDIFNTQTETAQILTEKELNISIAPQPRVVEQVAARLGSSKKNDHPKFFTVKKGWKKLTKFTRKLKLRPKKNSTPPPLAANQSSSAAASPPTSNLAESTIPFPTLAESHSSNVVETQEPQQPALLEEGSVANLRARYASKKAPAPKPSIDWQLANGGETSSNGWSATRSRRWSEKPA